jgi:hypothetical protein
VRRKLAGMSAEQVALIPECAECGEVWLPADEDCWKAYLDTDDELVFYCPKCAEREFGDVGGTSGIGRSPSVDRRLVLAVPPDTGAPHSATDRNQLGLST